MSVEFRIFVEDELVYSGNFSEVPQEHRREIVEALNEWGEVLEKGGLNEMIFSLFTWYNQKQYECLKCGEIYNEYEVCLKCGEELVTKNKYQRNRKISALLNCTGMITHLEIG